MIFYTFYKNQQIGYTIWDSLLWPGPRQFKILYRNALGLRLGPQKYLGPCNVVLRGGGRRARRNWAALAAPLAGEGGEEY
jgi:hypothetical protein